MHISDNTPIFHLTVGQFKELLEQDKPKGVIAQFDTTQKKHVYGLKGIRDLFNVSHATAQKYKDGILKDAVTQFGRKIIVDVEKAHELFAAKGGSK